MTYVRAPAPNSINALKPIVILASLIAFAAALALIGSALVSGASWFGVEPTAAERAISVRDSVVATIVTGVVAIAAWVMNAIIWKHDRFVTGGVLASLLSVLFLITSVSLYGQFPHPTSTAAAQRAPGIHDRMPLSNVDRVALEKILPSLKTALQPMAEGTAPLSEAELRARLRGLVTIVEIQKSTAAGVYFGASNDHGCITGEVAAGVVTLYSKGFSVDGGCLDPRHA